MAARRDDAAGSDALIANAGEHERDVMKAVGFLGGERAANGEWSFRIGRGLHGAFGGVLAAASLVASRPLAPGRTPAALHCHFLRGLPAGTARVVPVLIHAGRSLSVPDATASAGGDRR